MFRNLSTRKTLLAIAISAASIGAYAEESATKESDEADSIERIFVTGSRLTRTTFDAPTPTVVVSAEDIKISGATNINDLLSSMPQFGEGYDSTSGNYSFGNSGLNVVNLRGIGASRTLVLVNGKRPISISDDAQYLYADIGMIPSELVERVEVLTGGASAVYGSDAVAGVVNFILKKDYEGTSVRAQVGGTQDGGNSNRSLTLTHGLNFDNNRGNLSFSVDYLNESALKQSDRKGSVAQQRSVSNPLNTSSDDGIPDKVWEKNLTTTRWGAEATIFGIWDPETNWNNWYQVDSNGNPSLRVPVDVQRDGWLAVDGSGFDLTRWGQIEDPFERLNAYIGLNYHFDEVDLSFDVTYSKTESNNVIDPAFQAGWFQKAGLNSLFDVPAGVNDLLGDYDWVQMHYTFFEAGGRRHDNNRDYLASSLTLSGYFDNDWTWDINFSSGKTNATLVNHNALRNDRLDYNYQVIGPCLDSGNCPSFNPFERPSTELTDYILASHTTETDVTGHSFSANLAGDIYELPAGAVQLSTGAEVRYEAIDYQPSELWQSGNISSQMAAMDASRTIKEVYAEVLIPVVSDLPFVKMLDVEAALRKADYSTESASFTSSKIGVNWTINDSWRFRSTFSKAVRAPQLTEMFAGDSIGYVDMTDPCHKTEIDGGPSDGRRLANCAKLGISPGWSSNVSTQRGRTISSGYEELREEKAETLTVGFVYQPTYFDNFRLSLDYYDIKLEDLISGFGANSMLSNCVDLQVDSIDNDFCKLVSREANGNVSLVRTSSLNSDEARRRGLDIEADYVYDNLSFKLVATRQFEISETTFDYIEAIAVKDDYTGELGAQKWQSNFVTTYSKDDFSASWTFKFKQGGKRYLDASEERYDNQTVKNSLIHNLRAGYNISKQANVYVGINNVTNHTGLDHWLTNYGTRGGWGILGRTYYAGMTYTF